MGDWEVEGRCNPVLIGVVGWEGVGVRSVRGVAETEDCPLKGQ